MHVVGSACKAVLTPNQEAFSAGKNGSAVSDVKGNDNKQFEGLKKRVNGTVINNVDTKKENTGECLFQLHSRFFFRRCRKF